MERSRIGGLLLLVPLTLAAKSAQPSPGVPAPAKPAAFDAADIHPSPFSFLGKYLHMAPFTGDRFVAHQATPLDLITMAYKVEADAVAGGPPGLAFDRYEIVAKLPPGTTVADPPQMLQLLLEDRFKLVVEAQTKSLPVFLLQPGKGPTTMKLAADNTTPSDCRYQPANPPAAQYSATYGCVHLLQHHDGAVRRPAPRLGIELSPSCRSG